MTYLKVPNHQQQLLRSSPWTKPYLPSLTLNRKLQQPLFEADSEVVVVEETNVVVVSGAAAETVEAAEAVPNLKLASIRVRNTPTCQPEIGRGARCISDTAANVTSAQSPSLVLGRTSSPPSLQTIVQTIETGTSLAPPTINSISHNYILLCIKTISRKYIA